MDERMIKSLITMVKEINAKRKQVKINEYFDYSKKSNFVHKSVRMQKTIDQAINKD